MISVYEYDFSNNWSLCSQIDCNRMLRYLKSVTIALFFSINFFDTYYITFLQKLTRKMFMHGVRLC